MNLRFLFAQESKIGEQDGIGKDAMRVCLYLSRSALESDQLSKHGIYIENPISSATATHHTHTMQPRARTPRAARRGKKEREQRAAPPPAMRQSVGSLGRRVGGGVEAGAARVDEALKQRRMHRAIGAEERARAQRKRVAVERAHAPARAANEHGARRRVPRVEVGLEVGVEPGAEERARA